VNGIVLTNVTVAVLLEKMVDDDSKDESSKVVDQDPDDDGEGEFWDNRRGSINSGASVDETASDLKVMLGEKANGDDLRSTATAGASESPASVSTAVPQGKEQNVIMTMAADIASLKAESTSLLDMLDELEQLVQQTTSASRIATNGSDNDCLS